MMIKPERVGDDLPRLLLVDDDETFCGVLSEALGRRGFDVVAALEVEGALALAERYTPEYAVVDLRLGDRSGLELVRRLHELDENTRIVVLTGYASIATAVEAIKLGATHYLTKPADADEVLAALHRDAGDPGTPAAERPLSVQRLEWEHLQRVLLDHDHNISAAARALRMHRRTLQRKLRRPPPA